MTAFHLLRIPQMIDSTKDRLLGAMEHWAAERGFDAVSIRDVTGLAKANVAAVNYYFGSREGMIQRVLENRLRPVMLARREALQAEGMGERSVRDYLRAWLMPVAAAARFVSASDEEMQLYCRLMGRCFEVAYSFPHIPLVQEIQAMDEAYISGMVNHFPSNELADLRWKMHLCQGALIHALVHGHRLTPTLALEARLEYCLELMLRSFGSIEQNTPQQDPAGVPRSSKQRLSVAEEVAEAVTEANNEVVPMMAEMVEPQPLEEADEDDGYAGRFLF